MAHPLRDEALDQVFRNARTLRRWHERPVDATLIRAMCDLARLGPTESNSCPARFVFVSSAQAKARLEPHLDRGNVRQTMDAPTTAIVAYDPAFHDAMPKLQPGADDPRSWFANRSEPARERAALRSSSLQGAYLIVAARSLGLDCGPMSGFDREGVEGEFLAGNGWKANFLVNIGYGDRAGLPARLPRLAFDDFAEIH